MSNSPVINISAFLTQIDPFDKLPQEIVHTLASSIVIRYLDKGELITFSSLCKQRYLYIVRSGVIEQRTNTGELKARLGEEDQFGFTFLAPFSESEDGYQAHAIEGSLLYLIPHQVMFEIGAQHPDIANYFAGHATQRLHSANNTAVKKEHKSLFFRPVSDVASEHITLAAHTTPIIDVARRMSGNRPSSCAVVLKGDDVVGLITDRDMTRAVVAAEIDTQKPIADVMSPSPILIESEAKIIHAISLMLQYNIRCLPVTKHGNVVGLLTTTHLVHNHKTQSLFLIEKIKYATTVEELVALRSEKEVIFQALVESGVSSEIQGHVMSMIMDAFTRRLIQFSEMLLGPPPCEYAWLVAGSHARNEVHLLSDQDSAIVIADDVTESQKGYFMQLSMRVCNGLDACGYPLCSGKYMAATPEWCQPISRWREYYRKWVSSPEYNRLLNISVFLEIRAVHGSKDLVDQLHDSMHQKIQHHPGFLAALVRDAVSTQPPLSIFNSLVLTKNGKHAKTLNIKKYALNLIIDLARIYCLAAGGNQTGTEERFHYAVKHGTLSQDSCDSIIEAFKFITLVRFRHQMNAVKAGIEPNNHIDPTSFSSFERKHLKEAFKIIAKLQEVAKLKFTS
jgi:CBS domain-containing protein